jgi:hypothetical protein
VAGLLVGFAALALVTTAFTRYHSKVGWPFSPGRTRPNGTTSQTATTLTSHRGG